MGVWIEIFSRFVIAPCGVVTPLVGVWIEISYLSFQFALSWSLPSWECGLKYGKVA